MRVLIKYYKYLALTSRAGLEQNRTEQHFIEINVKKQSQAVRRQHMGRSIYIPNTVTSKRKVFEI